MTRAKTVEDAITEALILLEGARGMFRRSPTAENQNIVDQCERELDDLLDRYPHRKNSRKAERGTTHHG